MGRDPEPADGARGCRPLDLVQVVTGNPQRSPAGRDPLRIAVQVEPEKVALSGGRHPRDDVLRGPGQPQLSVRPGRDSRRVVEPRPDLGDRPVHAEARQACLVGEPQRAVRAFCDPARLRLAGRDLDLGHVTVGRDATERVVRRTRVPQRAVGADGQAERPRRITARPAGGNRKLRDLPAGGDPADRRPGRLREPQCAVRPRDDRGRLRRARDWKRAELAGRGHPPDRRSGDFREPQGPVRAERDRVRPTGRWDAELCDRAESGGGCPGAYQRQQHSYRRGESPGANPNHSYSSPVVPSATQYGDSRRVGFALLRPPAPTSILPMPPGLIELEPSVLEDEGLAGEGAEKIAWARSNMPVLAGLHEELERERPLEGRRIGMCLHVEMKTAVLVGALAAGGAEIVWTGSPATTDDAVAAAAARDKGIAVYSR